MLHTLSWALNSPPEPHAFVNLSLQSTYFDVATIEHAIGLVIDDRDTLSLEDRVTSYTNGILNYYFPWCILRNGEPGDPSIESGFMITPESLTHDAPRGIKRPDFVLVIWILKMLKIHLTVFE